MPLKDIEKRKAYQKDYIRRHYESNKDYYKKSANLSRPRLRKRNKEFIFNYLSTHPCVDCGEKDPIVLEFDHVKGNKSGNVSQIVSSSFSLEYIKKEIAKCEVRCANCHRRITHKRRSEPGRESNRRKALLESA